MAKTEPSEDRVFDVAKPGKSAPDDSSRPVIIGHRTILKDPTVNAPEDPEFPKEEKARETTTAPELKATSGEKVVIPISEKSSSKDKKKKTEDSAEEEKTAPEAPEESSEEIFAPQAKKEKEEVDTTDKPDSTDDKPVKKEDTTEEANNKTEEPDTAAEKDDEAAPAETPADQKAADKKEQEEIARQAALEKTVVDKTYFVPIGEVKRKRSNRRALLVLLVVIIIAVALADLLIDSGMIKTNIKAPVHIFKTNITG